MAKGFDLENLIDIEAIFFTFHRPLVRVCIWSWNTFLLLFRKSTHNFLRPQLKFPSDTATGYRDFFAQLVGVQIQNVSPKFHSTVQSIHGPERAVLWNNGSLPAGSTWSFLEGHPAVQPTLTWWNHRSYPWPKTSYFWWRTYYNKLLWWWFHLAHGQPLCWHTSNSP